MPQRILLVPSIGLFATLVSPLSAQDVSDLEAYENAELESQLATQPKLAPPPPTLVIPPPPPAPLPPDDYSTPPRLISYQAINPTPADYPVEAWREDIEGSVRFELKVNAEGKPTDCAILESSDSEALDAKTCEIALERAEFEPSLNADGVPVEGFHRDYHTWRKREPEFAGTSAVDVEYTISATGEVTDCNVIELSGVMSESMRRSFEREPCPGIDRPPRSVYRDENGNPVSKRIRLRLNVDVTDVEE